MRKGDFETAGRLVDLLERLDKGGTVRLEEIRSAYGVRDATARKYVTFLHSRRPTLTSKRNGKFKAWFLAPATAATEAQRQEAEALDFATRALKELEGTHHHRHLEDMARRARNALGNQATRADRITNSFHMRPVESSRNPARVESVKIIMEALEHQCVCSFSYENSEGKISPYEVEPWGLIVHRDELYLVAGKRGENPHPERRLFSVDRIQKAKVTRNARFTQPNLDLAELYQDSLGVFLRREADPQDIHLRVRRTHAVRLKYRAIHRSQRHVPQEGEWMDVHLRLVPCPQLESLILSMIPDVQVVAPLDLAKKIHSVVARWLSLTDA